MTNKMPVVNRKYQIGDSFVSKYPNGFKDIHRIISLTECPYQPYIFKGDDSLYGYWQSEKYIDEHYDWRGFEELPEDNLQQTEEMKANEVERALEELKRELKDWFESFPDFFLSKPECNHTWAGKRIGDSCEDCDDKFFSKVRPFCQNGVYYTVRKAQNLVNTLETEKNAIKLEPKISGGNRSTPPGSFIIRDELNSEPKIDMKEECVDPVSIWKDVSELPKNHYQPQCYFRFCSKEVILGKIINNECCSLDGSHEFPKEIVASFCTLTDFINSFEQMQKDIEELNTRLLPRPPQPNTSYCKRNSSSPKA